MAQLLSLLPPSEPPARFDPEPMKLQVKLTAMRREAVTYHVLLPPEYHHGRNYPVLFVLHEGGRKPLDMLNEWRGLAAQHGYVLVATEWEEPLSQTYAFTAEEQAAVVEVLRDLRRRFQVDSDRVFLFGFGEGANMAYDVGLSHPDLFAGIVPMSGRPRYHALSYWHNAQYLPFYSICGTYDGELPDPDQHRTRHQFKNWVTRGYPALLVEYKGRGLEWFGGELPTVFEWMSRKKRAPGFPELGKSSVRSSLGDEFQTMRPTDNHFYWLSTEEVLDRNLNEARSWNNRTAPATLQASISQGNLINLHVYGLKQVTVWLGSGMIDFEKPVTFRINGRETAWRNRPVKPNLGVLLEDFYQRGDRQRLFWARVDFNNL
jgi:predicted esterase